MRDFMLILHFIGLAMGLGTAFAHAFIGFAASKMTTEEGKKFKLNSQILSKMGGAGLVLLIVSGVYLLVPFWNSITSLPYLMLKLILVIILILLISMISILDKRARKEQSEIHFKRIEILGKVALLVTIGIVISAVLVFH